MKALIVDDTIINIKVAEIKKIIWIKTMIQKI